MSRRAMFCPSASVAPRVHLNQVSNVINYEGVLPLFLSIDYMKSVDYELYLRYLVVSSHLFFLGICFMSFFVWYIVVVYLSL